MKKEYYRAEREFIDKVGAEVALFEAGQLVWGTDFKGKHRDAPLGFSGAFMSDLIGRTPQLSFSTGSLIHMNCLPQMMRKTQTIVHF